jgi:hypothetical protein
VHSVDFGCCLAPQAHVLVEFFEHMEAATLEYPAIALSYGNETTVTVTN